MRAPQIVSSVKRLPYKDIKTDSKDLNFLRLNFEELEAMIEVYKAINQYNDKNTTITFDCVENSVKRGNTQPTNYRPIVNIISGGTFFTNRYVAMWNGLPDYVVDAHVNVFKNRLDRYWCRQELVYDYESELSGIRNRSFD